MFSQIKIEKNISFWLICLLTGLFGTIYGQGEKKYIRQGNGEYKNKKFAESEVSYRRAIDKNKVSSDAGFNLGDALYKQNKYEEAGKQFLDNSGTVTDNNKKAASFYNLGNALLKNNKIGESIQSYKNSLKLNPGSNEAKYNLAYAQDMLKQQQEQQKQDQKDKENNKDNKKEDQKKDQNKEQDKNQNREQNSNQDNKKDQNSQQQQQGISKEDAQRLLNAIANDEKNVQEKVKLAKAAKEKVRTRINW
jgi:Ca-activated chloride channel family protein